MNKCLPWVETSNKRTLGHMHDPCKHTLDFELAIKSAVVHTCEINTRLFTLVTHVSTVFIIDRE